MDLKSLLDLVLKIAAAATLGALIGIERERSHRAAGFRTHFLVAVGSAIVMITGEQLASRYGVDNVDPTRLSAQVISGIGFLGAGTILKEGINVKGLTTAASLWATACLGLAAGSGMFIVAALGTIGAIFALTVLESIEDRFVKIKRTRAVLTLHFKDSPSSIDDLVGSILDSHDLEVINHSALFTDGGGELEFGLKAAKGRHDIPFKNIIEQITDIEGVYSVKYIIL
ncbi:MAG: MgtC/SapB family protein [Eubacteriales bacterium]|jgi:putative Mg2+ transporter-C (MgtC) family protein